MPRRALALVALSLFAVAFAVASWGSREGGEGAVAEAPARGPKPLMIPSGAVAIEAPRGADASLQVVPLPAVAAMAAAATAGDAGFRPVPVDLATGKPLEPARVLEGRAAGGSMPVPRRVRDRGVITN